MWGFDFLILFYGEIQEYKLKNTDTVHMGHTNDHS